jgi:hypothetical protein
MSIAEEPLGLGYIIMLSTKKFVLSPVPTVFGKNESIL